MQEICTANAAGTVSLAVFEYVVTYSTYACKYTHEYVYIYIYYMYMQEIHEIEEMRLDMYNVLCDNILL